MRGSQNKKWELLISPDVLIEAGSLIQAGSPIQAGGSRAFVLIEAGDLY